MTLPQTYIGVDISKHWIDVFDPAAGTVRRLANQRAPLLAWTRRLADSAVVLFEATGGCERLLIHCLGRTGIAYKRMNPLRVRQFARATGRLAKTDRIDAKLLAMMGKALHPAPDTPVEPHRERLAALLARRTDIVAMIVAEQARLSSAADPMVRRDIEISIRALVRRRQALQKRIDDHIAAHADLAARHTLLQTAPGVGPQVASLLMAGLPELGQAGRRQIASLAGLAPHARESGLHKGKRAIHGGRPHLRRALYMAALAAIRSDTTFKTVYQHMRQNGKAAKTAIIAIARRLIVRINAMIRANQPYAP